MHRIPTCTFLFLLFCLRIRRANADVGTAASYRPPYLPTVCFGRDSSPFPTNNMFAAAGEGIWNNGASCGRQYMVRCLSSPTTRACLGDSTVVQVKIVDRASVVEPLRSSTNGTTIVLSDAAFRMIAESTAHEINIEFTQV